MLEKLFPDLFLKNQNRAGLWINNSLKVFSSVFLLSHIFFVVKLHPGRHLPD